MSRLQDQLGNVAPQEEWGALSEPERAEMQRRAVKQAAEEMGANRTADVPPAIRSPLEVVQRELAPLPTFAAVLNAAQALSVEDRVRLTGQLLGSLSVKGRAAVVTLALESLEQSANGDIRTSAVEDMEPLGGWAWNALFDPANTAELYSAPRRFDLATIFAVTSAYSLLFGSLTILESYFHFGPIPAIVLGSVVTIVAVCQALLLGAYNPRGVSIVGGTAAYVFFCFVLFLVEPRIFDRSPLVLVLFQGLFIGPILGYLSGVLVGGVFLAADAARRALERRTARLSGEAAEGSER